MPLPLSGALAFLCAGLLVYSQSWAFTWDESFHLLAAQLIDNGKRPYLDFVFPQTPLNAYWNALWMRLLGQTWRVPHAVSALMVTAAVLLAAQFVLSRLLVPRWRLACALATVVLTGLNVAVVEYGVLGQAYGTCLFLTVAAFRLTVAAAKRMSPAPAAAAGLFAGATAAASLLTAAVPPVLLLWLALCSHAGRRKKSAAFLAATAVPFLPVLWLFVQAPRQVAFNLFQYQFSARELYWPEPLENDLEVLTSWVDCGPALLLAILAAAGLLFVIFRSQWDPQIRREFYLCALLATAISAELAIARPTFTRYFLLAVPFAAILAAAGLYAVGSQLYRPDRPFWPTLALTLLVALGLARSVYDRHNDLHNWAEYEAMAAKVDEVTPRNGTLYANEPIYFLTRRVPPPGLEFYYSHKLSLPAPREKALHLLSEAEMNRQVEAGLYDTAFSCSDDEIKSLNLDTLYKQHAEVEGCTIFWSKAKP